VSYILLNHKTTRRQSESENRYTQYALADPEGGHPASTWFFFRSLRLWFMFKLHFNTNRAKTCKPLTYTSCVKIFNAFLPLPQTLSPPPTLTKSTHPLRSNPGSATDMHHGLTLTSGKHDSPKNGISEF